MCIAINIIYSGLFNHKIGVPIATNIISLQGLFNHKIGVPIATNIIYSGLLIKPHKLRGTHNYHHNIYSGPFNHCSVTHPTMQSHTTQYC